MTSRSSVQLLLRFTLAVTLLAGCLLTLSYRESRRLEASIRYVDRVAAAVLELNQLASEYLVYGLERTVSQWQTRSLALDQLLADHAATDAGGPLLAHLIASHAQQKSLFEALHALRLEAAAALQRPASGAEEPQKGQLLLVSSDTLKEAAALQQELLRARSNLMRMEFAVALAACLLLLVSLTLLRQQFSARILRPIAALQRETEAISSGDYQHTFQIDARDELGRLALAFSTMVSTLKAANTARSAETHRRDEVEDRLNLLAADLKRTNAELRQFALVASHDLQEPLRKIQAYGDMLRTECGAQLSANGQQYLERVLNACARMQTLINDLLALTRISLQAQPFTSVDLSRVGREVLADLEVNIQRVQGQVELGALPTVCADPLQMRQLLQNLLANALKFHRPDIPSRVTVTSEEVSALPAAPLDAARQRVPGSPAAAYRIYVRDNGIGFDEKYLDRIFQPFQRLNSRSAFEGSGIGLAICHKIVQRHGGDITASSAPGQGTTFVVTLPIRPRAAEGVVTTIGDDAASGGLDPHG